MPVLLKPLTRRTPVVSGGMLKRVGAAARRPFGIIYPAHPRRDLGLFPGRTALTRLPRTPILSTRLPRILMLTRRGDRPAAGSAFVSRLPGISEIVPPPGPIVQGFHPRHSCVYDGDTFFVAGQNGPIRWVFARLDGQLLDIPDAATVTITPPSGSPIPITPDVEATGPAAHQILACDYTMAQRGLYTVEILATFGSEIMGGRVTLVCDD